MKKFYSLVLMATALLIGTNAWAAWVGADPTTAQQLQDSIDNAGLKKDVGTVKITLGSDIELDRTIFLGTPGVDDPCKSIELDLNGHDILMNAGNSSTVYLMFVISHGELLVTNSVPTDTAHIELKGYSASNSTIFSVYGSYKSSRWKKSGNDYVENVTDSILNTRNAATGKADYFTHLEIGTGVEVKATSCSGTGIMIDEIYGSTPAYSVLTATGHDVAYTTCLFNKGGRTGLAQGVRVDIKGDINFKNTSNAVSTSKKSYAIKANGMLQTTLNKPTENDNSIANQKFLCDPAYFDHYRLNKDDHLLDTCDAPFIHIYNTARLQSNPATYDEGPDESDNSAAVYAGGYAKWLIEGTCEGNTALNSKSGEITVHDATLESTSNTYISPTGGTGASGSGSAVVLNSTDGYAGQINVTVTGDTKISAESGYAIEDKISGNGSDLKGITIEGGTIEGGTLGAIAVTAEDASKTTVYGGNISTATGDNTVVVDGQNVSITTLTDNTNTHVTAVTVDGKTTLVVSEGGAPTPKATWGDVVAAGEGANVKWTETGVPATVEGKLQADTTIILGELEINSGSAGHLQELTIPDGSVLQVKHLMMNDYARITVKAGGKLIVTGDQGIVGGVVDNIKLENEENKPAIFLFNPAVSSNRHPKATVEFTSKGYKVSSTNFAWQKFGVPTQTGELAGISIENDYATVFAKFNYAAATPEWEVIGYLNVDPSYNLPELNLADMNQAFEYYQMEHSNSNVGTKVTFEGKLVGNDCPAPVIRPNFWNGYANSYSAPIDAEALLTLIPAPADKAFYLYEQDNVTKQFSWVAQSMMQKSDIQPMQPFLIRNPKADATALALDYGAAVYTPATTNNAPGAPARLANDMTKVEFTVRGENGVDHVIVAEDAQFSAEFDNGYDVAKYMNDEVNMYVSADEKMAIYATDDIENTYLGFQTVKGGNYTIEFANVQGEELMLIDLDNNASVIMVAGNKYEFTADAKSVNDYRFKIVSTFNAPTAIENTEVVKSAKGIYTITGQYVGEMNVWNTLPAGIYVVNGEKLVK